MSRRLLVTLLGALALCGIRPAPACGPNFPNQVLLGGDEEALAAPLTLWAVELERLRAPAPAGPLARPPEEGQSPRDQTEAADLEDLRRALAAGPLPEERQTAVWVEYQYIRAALRALGEAPPPATPAGAPPAAAAGSPTPEPAFVLPAGLPAEFAAYFRGAAAWRRGAPAAARRLWGELLDRPAAERQWRSVWAAFMLGRASHQADPDEARRRYRQTRELAAAGFADSAGLAAASLGWEARLALDQADFAAALALYREQLDAGDPTAAASLQEAAGLALAAGGEALQAVAASGAARPVVTAYILARGGPFRRPPPPELVRAWLAAVEAAGQAQVAEAGRLAWAAYQAGELAAAAGWAGRAPEDDLAARWIRAKLLLRGGDVAGAAALLSRLAAELPAADGSYLDVDWSDLPAPNCPSPGVQVRGELGVLQLARGQFVEAFSTLARGGYWADAADVAERVLTLDELRAEVDAAWPAPAAGPTARWWQGNDTAVLVRWLLARRLMRAGRGAEAGPYFPPEHRGRAAAYLAALARGREAGRPAAERAAALWRAACLARYSGMELFGTEVEPDWNLHGGEYERVPVGSWRARPGFAALVGPGAEELARRQQPPSSPAARFHYRCRAADLAWEAARLMPDGGDETARVLCLAGSWLKDRDPRAADRFYKALVNRCRATALGAEADRIRWFPQAGFHPGELEVSATPSPTPAAGG